MNFKDITDKVAIITDFAERMGYDTNEAFFFDPDSGRPCYEIALAGTRDTNGEEYSWTWYLDTGEEIW